MVNAQEWLDRNYPKEKRSEVREICLNEPSLEGELDLGGFTYEYSVTVYISPLVDATKLIFKNLPKEVKIIKIVQVKKYINQKYPTKEKRKEVTWIDINFSGLLDEKVFEGDLDLSDFVNLKELWCPRNKLISLNLSNCSRLEKIYCSDNLLIDITLPTNPTNLKNLYLNNNNFPPQDLSFLISCTNLKDIGLGNDKQDKINQGIYNRFTGSLDCLSEMKSLRMLDISNTNILQRPN